MSRVCRPLRQQGALEAVVEVFDTRPAVKEEVMSLGAKFIEVEGVADASKAGGYAVEQSDDFQQRQKAGSPSTQARLISLSQRRRYRAGQHLY